MGGDAFRRDVPHFGIYVVKQDGKECWVEHPDGFIFWTTSRLVAAAQLELMRHDINDGQATVKEFSDNRV
jgi:hypothetical protein